MDRQTTINDQVNTIFHTWSQFGPRKHKAINSRMKRYINSALEKYSMQNICNAIINYAKVINHPNSWYKYKFNLDDFLMGKFERFLDDEFSLTTFLNRDKETPGVSVPDPGSPGVSPVEIDVNNYTEKFKQWKMNLKNTK